ncbi:MAG: bifunctional glutamate--cysteine ligase/glutathione synthetase [Spirochaetaceae bacterium 4572_7]|nr:MAG: bifunctional glutamate--cysteine ligase/glutathione synthetase [Spirochaetaceae bacterium 4572_7]
MTTDFSESQIEIITPPNDSIDKTYSMLENLHEIVSENLPENEYLWPSSMPPIIPDDDLIPIANYGDSDEAKEKVEYREYISKKYGKHKQLISGIHYNFSFNSDFLQSLHKNSATDQSFKDFKNDIYLTVARNLLKHQWLITYLMGANIAIHSSYKKCCDITRYEKGDEYHFKNACSFRNSICGYRNKEDFRVSYDNIDDNIKDLKKLISTGQLHGANEYYSPVRLKNPKSINGLDALEKDGIEYIELRMIDLNPLSKIGITKDDIYLIHLIIISSLLYPCSSYNKEEQATAIEKQNLVSLYGNKLPPHLIEEGLHFFKRMEQHLDDLSQKEFYEKIIKQAIDRINGNREIYSTMIYNMVDSTGYINHHLSVAKHNKKQSSSNKYALKGYEDLELSTQILIREALLKGLKVEVLDRTENFISIKNDTKIEYIKQATKTSLDPYSTALIMENKAITKKVLMDNNITVPNGGIFTSIDDAKGEYSKFKSKKVVIKPNNTNFGLGITILDENFSIKDYTNGLEIAFNKVR